ncbi:MAG TPA: CcmD family protein [Flavobacteriales bacterium]|nr:CcmD family protein [Flavobacteriales bacterium]HPH83681.1 CcmD family protein [Flavobacteriales bacterium]
MSFKRILLLFALFLSSGLMAQNDVEMADTFRADGKIYVVVAILSIVFTGIVLFLIRLDRKISHIEKEQRKSEKE